MAWYIRNGLLLIGFGLLFGFLGLLMIANLFGVMDESAREVSEAQRKRRFLPIDETPAEVKQSPAFVIGRYVAGIGFALVGLAVVAFGIVYMIAPPDL